MELSFGEMLVIVLVIVLLFGPDKLPHIARDLGQGMRKMRGAMEEVKSEILKETDNPVSEIKREIDKVKQVAKDFDPTEQIKKELDYKKFLEDSEKVAEAKPNPLDDTHEGSISR